MSKIKKNKDVEVENEIVDAVDYNAALGKSGDFSTLVYGFTSTETYAPSASAVDSPYNIASHSKRYSGRN